MKKVFLSLLAACVAAFLWLVLQGPVDVVREPGRIDQQLSADQFRLLTEADAARLRAEAERKAAAAPPAAPPASAAPEPVPPSPPAATEDLPLASCVDIGSFASDGAARKLRNRLAGVGLAERTSVRTVDKATHLRLTGIDAAAEVLIHEILKDFPHQEMVHCSEAAPARGAGG